LALAEIHNRIEQAAQDRHREPTISTPTNRGGWKRGPDASGPLLGLGGVDGIRGRRTNQPIIPSKSSYPAVLGAAMITRSG